MPSIFEYLTKPIVESELEAPWGGSRPLVFPQGGPKLMGPIGSRPVSPHGEAGHSLSGVETGSATPGRPKVK